jgi:hypothetical protein
MKLFLGLRSLLFLILIPGTVAGYIPWRILRASKQLAIPALSIGSTLAACLALLGICVLLLCVWDFFEAGRGTLAPFDPPKRLVVRGCIGLLETQCTTEWSRFWRRKRGFFTAQP